MENKWEILTKLYINRKLKIFPVVENGKVPRIPAWNKDCASDLRQVLYYYENNKTGNWGLPCYENNLFVLDLDRHDVDKDGVENFKKLCNDLGIDYPETLTQETPSGGIHLIFKSDIDLCEINATANAFPDYPGIDTRNRHYIVVEPSVIDGKSYKFVNNEEPREMPHELKTYILSVSQKKGDNKKTPYVKPKEVEKGDRDNQLFSYINQLYFKTTLDYDEILVLALHFNEEVLEEPFDERDVKYKVKKAFEKPRGKRILVHIGDE